MALAKKKDQEDPQSYIARKEYKKAIAIFRERVAKQPKNSGLKMNLADTLLMDNQIEDALREYKELASVYTDEGFIVKAIAIYKKMLKMRPDMKEVEHLLSELSDKRVMDAPRPKAAPVAQPMEMEEEAQVAEEEPSPLATQLEIEMKLFKDLAREEFQQIVAKLTLRHYAEDTIVVQEGDPGDSMFIVARGEVRVLTKDSKQKEVVLANLSEGEFFGEVSLLTGRPRTATIITNLDSELLELKREDFESIIAKFPHVKQVVEDFHQQRAYKTIEAMIQSLQNKE